MTWSSLTIARYLPRFRVVNLMIALIAFVVTELGREFYRPYVYREGIDDFGIADTLGNSFGVVTAIFFILAISGKRVPKDYTLLLGITLGMVLYELAQGPMGGAIDLKDIAATLIAGACSALLYRVVHRVPTHRRRQGLQSQED